LPFGIIDVGKSRPEVTATNEKCLLPLERTRFQYADFTREAAQMQFRNVTNALRESLVRFLVLLKNTHTHTSLRKADGGKAFQPAADPLIRGK